MKHRILVSLAVLFALSIVGCAIPGETKARYSTEQGRIEAIINSNELRQGHYHPVRAGVVDTKVVSIDDEGVITEHWFVSRGDHTVIYTIKMTPAAPTPSGYIGYDLIVAMPEGETGN